MINAQNWPCMTVPQIIEKKSRSESAKKMCDRDWETFFKLVAKKFSIG